jgi:hypothetical protein
MKTNHYLFFLTFLYLGFMDVALAQPSFRKHPMVDKLFEKRRRIIPNEQSPRIAMTSPLPRSINYYWDPALINWQVTDTTDYQYDAQGRVIEEVTFNGFSNLRITYLYDAQGRITDESYYSPVPTGWQITQKSSTVYNADGEVELLLELGYNAGQVVDTTFASRLVTTMNPVLNKPAKKTTQSYKTMTDSWENVSEVVFEYNANGLVRRSVESNWGFNKWDTIGQIVNTWSANNRISSFILSLYDTIIGHEQYLRLNGIQYQTWNGTFDNSQTTFYQTSIFFNNSWIPTQRTRTTYDANGGFVQIDSSAFFSPTFEPDMRYSFIVNAQGDFEGEKSESWQNNAWQLQSHDELQYTYNTQGQIEEIITRYYDLQLAVYINETRKDYVPGIVQGLEPEFEAQEVKIEAFPNPASEFTTLRLKVPQKELLQIMLIDMNGRVIYQRSENSFEKGVHKIQMPMYELPKGSYIMRVQGSKRSSYLRVLKN